MKISPQSGLQKALLYHDTPAPRDQNYQNPASGSEQRHQDLRNDEDGKHAHEHVDDGKEYAADPGLQGKGRSHEQGHADKQDDQLGAEMIAVAVGEKVGDRPHDQPQEQAQEEGGAGLDEVGGPVARHHDQEEQRDRWCCPAHAS